MIKGQLMCHRLSNAMNMTILRMLRQQPKNAPPVPAAHSSLPPPSARAHLFQSTLLLAKLCQHECSVAGSIDGTIQALRGGAATATKALQVK